VRVLVTGAAGFIGSHLVEALLSRGDEVVGLDNFDDYYDPAVKRQNLAQLQAHASTGNLEFVEGDIRDRPLLDQVLGAGRAIDRVAHLAALAGVRASIERAALYYDVNVMGTIALLDAVRAHGKPHFVFASTSSVYGNSSTIPFVETDACDRPLAPYPASKRSAELIGHAYHNLFEQTFTALRFFTVYGPRNRPDMMGHMLLDNIHAGRRVEIFEAGQLRRDWTFVDDIVQGVVSAIDRPLGYEVLNIGRGQPVLLSEFIECVEATTGGRTQLHAAPMPSADVEQTYADIDRARRLLDYEPSTSLQDGVRAMCQWYDRRRGA